MLCLSSNCFIIVLLCDTKSLVYCYYYFSFLLFVLVSNFFFVLREEQCMIVYYCILLALFFRYWYLLGNDIDCLSNCCIGESTFQRTFTFCTALHVLDNHRSIPLELEVCSLCSGFLGWNLCATECSWGYSRGFIEESQLAAWQTTGAVGLMDNGKDQNAKPLCKVTYSKHTLIGVMESCCRGKYSKPAMSECTIT